MDEAERMWIRAALIGFCVFILTVGGCEVHEARQKAKVAIELDDSFAAKCLFARSNSEVCIIYATRRAVE